MQSQQKYDENIQACWKVCDDIVAERRAHPRPEVNDLLNAMLHATDPETGEKMRDELIRYEMMTFLIGTPMSDAPFELLTFTDTPSF